MLGPGARVGFVQLPDWTYSPVKNNLADAVKKAASGVAPRCASEGELEMYEGTVLAAMPVVPCFGCLSLSVSEDSMRGLYTMRAVSSRREPC